MIEAPTRTFLPVSGAAGLAPLPARPGESRRAPRYELSPALDRFLRGKYLDTGIGTSPASNYLLRGAPARTVTPPSPLRSARAAAMRIIQLVVLALTVALFATLAFVVDAHADQVVLAESGLIVGQQTGDFSFTAPAGGMLDIKLEDFVFPASLSSLTLSITTATGSLDTMIGPGETSVLLDGAGTYYAHIAGQAGGSLDIGAYGLLATLSPLAAVPLPASLTLVLSGGAAAAFSLYRRRKA